jgi:hypothetical protein
MRSVIRVEGNQISRSNAKAEQVWIKRGVYEAEPHSRDKRQMPNVVFSIWRSGDFSLAQSGQTPNAKH